MDPSRASPEKVIESVDVPILFIHAGYDSVTPVEHAHRLYAKANEPKELWRRTANSHLTISEDNLPKYERRVLDFFKKYLLEE